MQDYIWWSSDLNGKSEHSLINDDGKLSLQVGANANTTIDLDLSVSFTMSSMQAHIGGVSDGNGYNDANKTFDVSTTESAQKVLESIDDYIAFIDSKRSDVGAVSNRLNSTISNQENMHEMSLMPVQELLMLIMLLSLQD